MLKIGLITFKLISARFLNLAFQAEITSGTFCSSQNECRASYHIRALLTRPQITSSHAHSASSLRPIQALLALEHSPSLGVCTWCFPSSLHIWILPVLGVSQLGVTVLQRPLGVFLAEVRAEPWTLKHNKQGLSHRLNSLPLLLFTLTPLSCPH